MEKFYCILICLLCLNVSKNNLIHQPVKIIEGLKIKSEFLKKDVDYAVYLPPDYDDSKRKYPIIYLLHGYTDDESGWVQFGEIQYLADKAINEGIIPPMIIVMPDAGITWYINDHEGKVPYEDFFIKEFIPKIEEGLRVRVGKQFRGIAGLSMGGYGALVYAMKHPDLFTAAAPLSAAIYTQEDVINHDQERWDRVEGVMYGKGRTGQDRITEHWQANNPFYIAKEKGEESLRQVAYYFDCGDDDFLYRGNAMMHLTLRDMGVPHEFRVRDGAHNWTYWRTGITDALQFIGNRFHR
jgi:S-formylglutathione hydrolase FrmB